jgi:WD40 repeat protein
VPYAVSIWEGDLSHEISRLPVSTRTAIALSADGQRIATSHNLNDTSVRAWDTATGQLLLTLSDIDPHRGDIAFTRDGRLIAGRVSGGITIWETQKPKCGACPNGR